MNYWWLDVKYFLIVVGIVAVMGIVSWPCRLLPQRIKEGIPRAFIGTIGVLFGRKFIEFSLNVCRSSDHQFD